MQTGSNSQIFRASTEGEKLMSTNQISITAISLKERVIAGIAALAFGLFLTYATGFAGSSVLHNAAHDTRHSVGFPCH